MRLFFLSKNYREITSAGNKAKTDMEKILSNLGYKNAGLPQTVYSNQVIGFILTLIGIFAVFFKISANDIVVVQYPFKKYYSFVCNLIHWRKGNVITLVHDLGAFRRKKISINEEIKRLNHSDVLIVLNSNMKSWLRQQGYNKPMVCLEIWDYLSSTVNDKQHHFNNQSIRVMYAGGLSDRKNKFLYALDNVIYNKWYLELYGIGFKENKIKNRTYFTYCGFVSSDQLIENTCANFGLIWDGESAATCSGNFGEYLKINNPHKASLYIRCNCPVIIWEEAALASFISNNKIGICIKSLEDLNNVFSSISSESYNEMVENVKIMDKKISSGYYLSEALEKAKNYL